MKEKNTKVTSTIELNSFLWHGAPPLENAEMELERQLLAAVPKAPEGEKFLQLRWRGDP